MKKRMGSICFLILFITCPVPDVPKKDINNLRNKILSELSNLKTYKPDNQKHNLIIQKKCGMVNANGICCFNSVIQCLFANKKFILFYLMNNFDTEQIMSKNIQTLLYKMLVEEIFNPIQHLLVFARHPRLVNHCTTTGGNPLILLEEILMGLQAEIKNIDQMYFKDGSPTSFMAKEIIQTRCKICEDLSADEVESASIRIPFSNTIEESINFFFNNRQIINQNKYFLCKTCNKFNPVLKTDMTYEITYPDNLILDFERVQIKNNTIYSIFQEIKLNKAVQIGGNVYVLYAAVCSYRLKNSYHANSIVFKDGNWTIFNDDQMRSVFSDYHKSSIFNNNAWILFYRKLEHKK